MHSRMVTATEANALVPSSGGHWVGGVHSPSDGHAEPTMACTAIAQAAQRQGATIYERCAARGIESQAGQIHAVVTEKGKIRTSHVLCAAGAWNPSSADGMGSTSRSLA